uniref:Trihelix transcription factor GT-4-like n=1 Tax=Crassostrea virginica TaxID=6565 RepID=A0A8B8ECP4_CRAVI|nr:trihelix transcription factor GT-4-like [Crassostrea virginica]
MAQGGKEICTVKVRGPDGTFYTCQMGRDVFEMIQSPTCDREVRQTILKEIYGAHSKPDRTDNMPVESHESGSENHSLTNNVAEMNKIHNWTESEERKLISERLDMEEDFNSCKSHDTLWKKIKRNLEEEGIIVTVIQVINKWKIF